MRIALVDARRHRRIALWVEIDQQHAASGLRERGGEIDRVVVCRPAFLVDDRNDALHGLLMLWEIFHDDLAVGARPPRRARACECR